MPTLFFNGNTYPCANNESVLEVLTRQGASIPSACRIGVCQTCLMRSSSGCPPAGSQKGLKETLKAQDYFLACQCLPQADMEISLPATGVARVQATVHSMEPLNEEIIRVMLDCPQPFEYRSGQFVNLFKDATLGRSYSLASVPACEPHLQLHIRKVPEGRVSNWAHHCLRPGAAVQISHAAGDCFYVAGNPEQPVLLIGTGSGLAPIYGIVRDALMQQHRGPIRLYHGSRNPQGLYLVDELRAMEKRHAHFSYTPCVSGEGLHGDAYTPGRALDIALADIGNLTGWRVFLCGNPEMVRIARKKVFLAGAAIHDIYADAFVRAVS